MNPCNTGLNFYETGPTGNLQLLLLKTYLICDKYLPIPSWGPLGIVSFSHMLQKLDSFVLFLCPSFPQLNFFGLNCWTTLYHELIQVSFFSSLPFALSLFSISLSRNQ